METKNNEDSIHLLLVNKQPSALIEYQLQRAILTDNPWRLGSVGIV